MKLQPRLSWLSYFVGLLLIVAGLSTWPHMQIPLILLGGSFFAPLVREGGSK